MYIKTKCVQFDALTITIVMLGKFVCTFFLMGRSRTFLGIRIKFHLGRAKGRGKTGYGGEAQNEGYFCKIPNIQQDINFISQTFGQQTSNHHHCDQHAQKPICRDFSSDFKQFFLVKNNLLTLDCNDADDANDYKWLIGIALLKAFSCANNVRCRW